MATMPYMKNLVHAGKKLTRHRKLRKDTSQAIRFSR